MFLHKWSHLAHLKFWKNVKKHWLKALAFFYLNVPYHLKMMIFFRKKKLDQKVYPSVEMVENVALCA